MQDFDDLLIIGNGENRSNPKNATVTEGGLILDDWDLAFLSSSENGSDGIGREDEGDPLQRRNPCGRAAGLATQNLEDYLERIKASDEERARREEEEARERERREQFRTLTGMRFTPNPTSYQAEPIAIPWPFGANHAPLPFCMPLTDCTLTEFLSLTDEESRSAMAWASEMGCAQLPGANASRPRPDMTVGQLLGTPFSALQADMARGEFDAVMADVADALSQAMPFEVAGFAELRSELLGSLPDVLGRLPLLAFASLCPEYSGSARAVREEAEEAGTLTRLHRIRGCVSAFLCEYGSLDDECDDFGSLYLSALVESRGGWWDTEPRDIGMLCHRLGLRGASETLAEVGARYGVGGERVRQITRGLESGFDASRSKRLVPYRLAVAHAAASLGMAGSVEELAEALAEADLWDDSRARDAAVRLCPDLDCTRGAFRVPGIPCAECEAARRQLEDLARAGGHVRLEDLVGELGCAVGCRFTPSFDAIATCMADSSLVRYVGGYVGSARDPLVRKLSRPKSRINALRWALQEVDGPITIAEAARAISDGDPTRADVATAASFMSGPGSGMVLWGSGTYLPARLMPHPAELADEVATWVTQTFRSSDTPIVCVEGVFRHFEGECAREGVPNRHALYSVLRWRDDRRLILDDHPWICDAWSIKGGTTFAEYFGYVMWLREGYVTDQEADDIAGRAMVQDFQLQSILSRKDNLVRADGGIYDLDMLDIDYGGVEDLVREVADSMRRDDLVSSSVVFSKHRARLERVGVMSHELLYRIVERHQGSLALGAGHLPYLTNAVDGRLTVTQALRAYVRDAGREVSLQELKQEFVVKRGVARQNVAPCFILGGGVVSAGGDHFAWGGGPGI